MGRKRTRTPKPTMRRAVEREVAFVPKSGPGQVFVQEGERESRHYRNVGSHPLELALERKQITPELHAAGNTFRVMFEKMGRSGIDSTQAMMAPGGTGSGVPFTDAQVQAIRDIKKIEDLMPKLDYRIIRKFCGEGYAMAEAVMAVTSCHPSGVKYRMVEALQGLDDALDKLRVRRVA